MHRNHARTEASATRRGVPPAAAERVRAGWLLAALSRLTRLPALTWLSALPRHC